MAQVDVTAFQDILPVLSFLVVLIISFFAINKSKLIGNKFFEAVIALTISIVFVAATGPRNFILVIIPAFAIVIFALFLIMAMGGFLGKDAVSTKLLGKIFLGVLIVIFVISAFFVFSTYITPYLPGNSGIGGNPDALNFLGWVYSPKVAGTILVVGIGIVAAWLLIRSK